MEIRLRPLTLGEILDRTAQLYRSHFWLFAGIASVNSGAVLLFSLIQIGGQELLRLEHLTRYAIPLGAIWLAVMFFVSFVVGGIAMAANNRAVAWVHLGEPATIRGAYAGILPRTGRYVWLMTIVTFMMWWPLALTYGCYILGLYVWLGAKGTLKNLAGPSAAATPADQATILIIALVTILFGVLCLACLAYALVMFLRYSLAIAAAVVENLGARQAIRRSVELSKGSRGRIFVLALLVIVIQLGLLSITQFVFIVMSLRHGELPAGARVLQQLVAFVTNTFIGPIYATGFTLFYYDQRVRKEGYDIEWMMQAAGLTGPAQAAGPGRTMDDHGTATSIEAPPAVPATSQTDPSDKTSFPIERSTHD